MEDYYAIATICVGCGILIIATYGVGLTIPLIRVACSYCLFNWLYSSNLQGDLSFHNVVAIILYNQGHSVTCCATCYCCSLPRYGHYIRNAFSINWLIVCLNSLNCTSHVRHQTWGQYRSCTWDCSQYLCGQCCRSNDWSNHIGVSCFLLISCKYCLCPCQCRRNKWWDQVLYIGDRIYIYGTITNCGCNSLIAILDSQVQYLGALAIVVHIVEIEYLVLRINDLLKFLEGNSLRVNTRCNLPRTTEQELCHSIVQCQSHLLGFVQIILDE